MPRKSCLSFGLVLIFMGSSGYAADRPAGYTTLCTSNDVTCRLNITTNVAFGRNNSFAYKVLSGEFICDAATFGYNSNRLGEGVYECSVPTGPASTGRPGNYSGPEVPASTASST